MKASELLKELQDRIAEKGDFKVVLQGDDEGNSYRAASGADVVVRQTDAGEDDYCYNTMEEAHDDGWHKDDIEYILVVY